MRSAAGPWRTLLSDALSAAPLGKSSSTPEAYDPGLLFPIPRSMTRDELGLGASLPFMGQDLWTAFEMGWLNPKGKPQVGIAHIRVPCETPFMIESKSFKLYLNSFNNERLASSQELVTRIEHDINAVLWGDQPQVSKASCRITPADGFGDCRFGQLEGLCLDRLDIEVVDGAPVLPLRVLDDEAVVTETLNSHLLRALCRVTGQPDWGSIQIDYTGHPIDQERLLQYLIGFRNQQEFHEPLSERVFMDIWRQCKPMKLRVWLRFTRRGGLDINPVRTSYPAAVNDSLRLARQ